jgi:hypothetical protein
MLKFARCMRQHGVAFPDPNQSGTTSIHISNPQAFDSAQKACDRFRAAGEKSITPAQRAAFQDQALKFARCMRAHGIDMPDPQNSGSGGIAIQKHAGPGGGGPDPSSPIFQSAQTACQSLLGKGAGTLSTQAGPPPGSKGPGGNATFSFSGPPKGG